MAYSQMGTIPWGGLAEDAERGRICGNIGEYGGYIGVNIGI